MSQQKKNREKKEIICDLVSKQNTYSKENIKGLSPVER